MRTVLSVVLAVVICVVATWVFVALAADPKSEEVTVTGEAVDLWCYMAAGLKGAEHKECATTCAKLGQPIGILDQKGSLYLALGSKNSELAKDLLTDKMASKVTVTGTLVKKEGISAIFVKTVK